MQKEIKKQPIMLYTEQTPNPETLKFVTNQMIYPRKTAEFKKEDLQLAEEWSPIAFALLQFETVKSVYICNNFITLTKESEFDWDVISMDLKKFIKDCLEQDMMIVKEGYEEIKAAKEAEGVNINEDDSEIVIKIKQLLDKYVKPAVEMDGGNIQFHSFDEGVVKVVMQGACSGCPSSTGTLKVGIEGMLKRMCPEVVSVEAVMG